MYWSRDPGMVLKTLSKARKSEKKNSKSFEISHPAGPENTEKIKKKYENSPKMTAFVFFFVFSGARPRVGDFVFSFFFGIFSSLRALSALYRLNSSFPIENFNPGERIIQSLGPWGWQSDFPHDCPSLTSNPERPARHLNASRLTAIFDSQLPCPK